MHLLREVILGWSLYCRANKTLYHQLLWWPLLLSSSHTQTLVWCPARKKNFSLHPGPTTQSNNDSSSRVRPAHRTKLNQVRQTPTHFSDAPAPSNHSPFPCKLEMQKKANLYSRVLPSADAKEWWYISRHLGILMMIAFISVLQWSKVRSQLYLYIYTHHVLSRNSHVNRRKKISNHWK
jgi:hypothetical protein